MRKTKEVTFGSEAGRDAGKVYVLTEMSAARSEKWAVRALLALGAAGFKFPPDIAASGMAAMALVGINSLLSIDYYLAEPLLDEMMACVKIRPSGESLLKYFLAKARLMTAATGSSSLSRTSKSRPARRGTLSVSR